MLLTQPNLMLQRIIKTETFERNDKIITGNNFCVRHKNRRKHNQHFKVLFLTINLQVITSNQIFTYRKLNFPLTNQSTPHVLFATHKPLKVAAAKALLFRGVWHWYNLLRWMFFIPLLFIKVYHFSEEILIAMLLLSLKPVFWKRSVFYALSPQ